MLRKQGEVLFYLVLSNVHIHWPGDTLDTAGAGVLPDVVLVAEAQRIAVLGDPDVVLADVRKVQRVIEPAGIGVNARAVPGVADRLAESDGAGRALGGAVGVGAAARNALGAAGGVLGSLSASQWGSIAEKLAESHFSKSQEYAADDFSFGFLQRNGYDPIAMADALEKIHRLAEQAGNRPDAILQLFSTHPDSLDRAARIRAKRLALPAESKA